MATQSDVIRQVIRCASFLKQKKQDAMYHEVLTHLIEETAEEMNVSVNVPECLEAVLPEISYCLDSKPRPIYSPLSTPQNKYPSVDLQTEQRVWKLLSEIYSELLKLLNYQVVSKMDEPTLKEALKIYLPDILKSKKISLNQRESDLMVMLILDDIFHLGPLELLLADSSVSDILVNGPREIYIDRHGQLTQASIQFRDDAHLIHVIKKLVNRAGKRIDMSQPYVDARLADGSRVNAVLPPLSVDAPSLSIRRFTRNEDGLDQLAFYGVMTGEMAALLSLLVHCRLNIVVSGGTGSGKTTLLNAMSWSIDANERVVTIEDAAELKLNQPHVLRMETKQADLKGEGAVPARQLVINSLRMRPDRVIIGEVRGAEAFDVLQAMNVGHDGSMTTLHANSTEKSLLRLVNMVLMSDAGLGEKMIMEQVTSVIDLIVNVYRLKDGRRKIMSVTEVMGLTDEGTPILRDLFTLRFRDGEPYFEKAKLESEPSWMNKIENAGLVDEFKSFFDWEGA